MICYHFGIFYMSSIQQGIQAAHAQTEMALKAYDNEFKAGILAEWSNWARKDKTMVCLNAGTLRNLKDIRDLVIRCPVAWGQFHESEEDLGGILTNVCFVANDAVCDLIQFRRKNKDSYWVERRFASNTTKGYEEGYTLKSGGPSNFSLSQHTVHTQKEMDLIDTVAGTGLAK